MKTLLRLKRKEISPCGLTDRFTTTCGYVRNTRTGENMGDTVELHMNLYDDEYNKLDVATYEEDCYEFVEGENDGTIYE